MSITVFRRALEDHGITSGSMLADHMEAPAVIFFFGGRGKPYAELRVWDGQGDMVTRKFQSPYPNMSMAEARRKTVAAAREEAKEMLGLEGWTKSPFDNCWLPQEVLLKAREEFLGESAETG